MAGKKVVAGDKLRLQFGARVRELRLERNHSQERLAELAGLHRNYIGSVERGEKNPGLESIYALADALRIPVVDLFDRAADVVADGRRVKRRL